MPGVAAAKTLYSHAAPVPIAIRVNMLRCRVRSELQPRTKKGQPPQSTTGVPRASCAQVSVFGKATPARGLPGIISAIAIPNTGNVRQRLTQSRRVMSVSSGFSSSATSSGSSAMPQIGQEPGSSLTISGCIGQVQRTCAERTVGSSAIPHFGQDPGVS